MQWLIWDGWMKDMPTLSKITQTLLGMKSWLDLDTSASVLSVTIDSYAHIAVHMSVQQSPRRLFLPRSTVLHWQNPRDLIVFPRTTVGSFGDVCRHFANFVILIHKLQIKAKRYDNVFEVCRDDQSPKWCWNFCADSWDSCGGSPIYGACPCVQPVLKGSDCEQHKLRADAHDHTLSEGQDELLLLSEIDKRSTVHSPNVCSISAQEILEKSSYFEGIK